MFQDEIFSKSWGFLLRGGGLDPGGSGLACKRRPSESPGAPLREIRFNIDFLYEAHGCSSRSVDCLYGARLERSLES
jgi:hypothetical protein